MRDIVSPLSGFGSPFGQRRRAAQIITAVITPALGPMTDGDTIASALSADIDQTSNYASTEGTIASVDVVITVNGDPALASDTVDFADVVSVVVTVTDSEANQRVFTLGRTVAGIAPTNDVAPAIAGDTGLGDTLTVTAGTWSGVPAPALAYQWLRGGVEIAGETGTTYDITLADSGALITVRETATNAEGSASEVSNAITADTFTAPVNTVAPSISGDTDLGATLTRTEGTWSGNPTPTLSGQWQRDGAAISGATGTTYVIVEDDQGTDITYLETATNAVGSAAQVSNALAIPEASTGPSAAGGTETVIEQGGKFYRVHTFLESGTLTVTAGGECEYLLIAGGGGGGVGGGGGAGGYRASVPGEPSGGISDAEPPKMLTIGTYPVEIGAGGAGGSSEQAATDGADSSFAGVIAAGGGRGSLARSGAGRAGGPGGSGGGSAGSGTAGQGFIAGENTDSGNTFGAGGGGAGGPGEGAEPPDGGTGIASAVTGATAFRAGGGGGATNNSNGDGGDGGGGRGARTGPASDGESNTGGGGGASHFGTGGAGGSGIAIIRYEISEAEYNAEAA